MSRRTARNHAFTLIYQLEFHKDIDIPKVFEEYCQEYDIKGEDKEFIYQEFSGTFQNIEKLNEYIAKYLKGWTLNRLNKIDIAIMRLSIYEILFMADIPYSVSVNEAVEIAKAYSTDEGPSFINGILGSVVKEIEGN